jgi:hypothetical protein
VSLLAPVCRFFSLGDVFSVSIPTSDADVLGVSDPVVSVLEGGASRVWHFQVVELQPPLTSSKQQEQQQEGWQAGGGTAGNTGAFGNQTLFPETPDGGAGNAGPLPLRIDPLTSTEVSLVVSAL